MGTTAVVALGVSHFVMGYIGWALAHKAQIAAVARQVAELAQSLPPVTPSK